jgi:hypothetical protein
VVGENPTDLAPNLERKRIGSESRDSWLDDDVVASAQVVQTPRNPSV